MAFVTLLWTASGMTRSLRVALGVVWDTDRRPAFVRAKLRDVTVLGALAALVLAVFLLSLAAQIAVQAGVDLSAALGLGDAADVIARAADLTVIGAATFAALVLVYRLGAPAALAFTDVWRVALVAAVAIDLRAGRLRVLPRQHRRPGHHLRAAGCAARAVGPAVHGGGDRALRRRVAGLTRSG